MSLCRIICKNTTYANKLRKPLGTHAAFIGCGPILPSNYANHFANITRVGILIYVQGWNGTAMRSHRKSQGDGFWKSNLRVTEISA